LTVELGVYVGVDGDATINSGIEKGCGVLVELVG
jgi:hypothetical protein